MKGTGNFQLYFLGILPPKDLQDEVTDIKKDFSNRFKAKHALKSPPHITLYMPFKWEEKQFNGLSDSLQLFTENRSSFSVGLNGFEAFPPRVIFIQIENSEQLNKLHSELLDWLSKKLGIYDQREWGRPYSPHLTVAHKDLKRGNFIIAWEEYKDKAFVNSFLVESFVLLHHLNGKWEPCQEFFFGNK
ncbi:2'-5' RNA ligase family protein [Xanthovirga aplysinae]|uniref:2'-5' RNA ligase family protein n=1 Tax=Xanthovirga aplysinae TaxID=2529853 RepID=UPI001FE33069|nr:2'-5' RNA ligase family protein [Xanthovirga aplysinae]